MEVTGIMRASGVVMEALRVTIVCARTGEVQPTGGVGSRAVVVLVVAEGLSAIVDTGGSRYWR